MVGTLVGGMSIVLLLVCLAILGLRAIRSPGQARRCCNVRAALRALGEGVVAFALIAFSMVLAWMAFGIQRHSLVLVRKTDGLYGFIKDDATFTPGTRIVRMEATYVPSRILRVWKILWPVPEALSVEITYQRPGESVQTWERTYLLACSADEASQCVPLYDVLALMLCGDGVDGDGEGGCAYQYLRGQIIPHLPNRPCPPAAPVPPLLLFPFPFPVPFPPVSHEPGSRVPVGPTSGFLDV